MKKQLAGCLVILFLGSVSAARETNELADLNLSISSSSTVATNGQWVTFYVTARNNGPTPIYAVDNCAIGFNPAAGQYGDNGAGGGDPTDAVVSGPGTIDKSGWEIDWRPGVIAPGHAVVMTVSVPLHIRNRDALNPAQVNGNYSNSNICDTNPSNNMDELQLGYVPASDLSVTIDNQGFSSWDLFVGAYEIIFYASNAGPSVVENAVVTNTLPPDCTYEVTWPEDETRYAIQGNKIIWQAGELQDGIFRLWPGYAENMYVSITPTNGGEKVVSSRVYYPHDTLASNDFAESSMLITGSAGGGETNSNGVVVSVSLMGWDVVPEVERYGTIQYTLRLKNNMESDFVTDVMITNRIDSRCLFDSATTPQGTVTQNNGVVVFNIGTVNAGTDLYLDLFVTPLESGVMTNDARLYMNESGNEYGDSAAIEETLVRQGPYVLTVTPMSSAAPTLGYRQFEAVVQTNGQTVANVPLYAEIIRGPHMGLVSNMLTTAPAPGAPAKAVFALWDDGGYPGMDYISVTGQVGKIPFSLNVEAEWRMTGPRTYVCTNSGYITDNGESVFEIYVPDGFEIADIKTGLHFIHTYPGDLEFRLYSPSDNGALEIEAYLIEELAAFGVDDLEVGRTDAYCVLDESASISITSAVSPFSGSHRSQSMELTNFVGVASMGTWRLVIEDMNVDDFDYGELLGWTLILNPDDGDSDNDGMNDNWELDNELDPNNPDDGELDNDNDGSSNRFEFLARTRPQDPGDCFALSWPSFGSGYLILRWNSETNQFYSVLWSTNLLNGFSTLESEIPATPPQNEYMVTNMNLRGAFFRIDQEY